MEKEHNHLQTLAAWNIANANLYASKLLHQVILKKQLFPPHICLHYLQVAPRTYIPALFGHAKDDKFIQSHHSDLIFQSYAVLHQKMIYVYWRLTSLFFFLFFIFPFFVLNRVIRIWSSLMVITIHLVLNFIMILYLFSSTMFFIPLDNHLLIQVMQTNIMILGT